MTSPSDTEPVREVLARHKTRLMAMPEVQGVGMGADPGGKPAIVIYLKKHLPEPGPASLDGVPVQYVVTGKIEPLK